MHFSSFVTVLIFFVVHGQTVFFNSFPFERNINSYVRLLRVLKFQFLGRNSEDANNLRRAHNINILQTPVPLSVTFPCNVTGYRSLKPPTSVHQLQPGDIDVIGALGDSLTAGNGLVATNSLHVFVENRGLSWSIGGQGTWREYLTLPNILKEFNPSLIGYSLRDSLTIHLDSQFNPSEAGAKSADLPYMAKVLVTRIQFDSRVDLKNHWKLITILIGGNDFCLNMCYHEDSILMKHRTELMSVLRFLRDNLPRTIINLVPPPDVTIFNEIDPKPLQCAKLHKLECSCIVLYPDKKQKYREIINKWQKIDEEIANMDEFDRNDFAVVYQPFLLNIQIPLNANNKTDFTFFSQDCFHLSQKFNAKAANLLWNNMLERTGEKTIHFNGKLFGKFSCPTRNNPYIYTKRNSYL